MEIYKESLSFFSVPRSGHHAIVNWTCLTHPKKCIHYNAIPYETFIDGTYIENTHVNRIQIYNKDLPAVHVVNIEDKLFIEDVKNLDTFPVIIIRDIRNMLASTIKSITTSKYEIQGDIVGMWQNHVNNMDSCYYIVYDK